MLKPKEWVDRSWNRSYIFLQMAHTPPTLSIGTKTIKKHEYLKIGTYKRWHTFSKQAIGLDISVDGLGSEAGGWGCVAISLVSLHKHLRKTSTGQTRSMKELNSPGGEIEGFQRLSMCLYHVQIYVLVVHTICANGPRGGRKR